MTQSVLKMATIAAMALLTVACSQTVKQPPATPSAVQSSPTATKATKTIASSWTLINFGAPW